MNSLTQRPQGVLSFLNITSDQVAQTVKSAQAEVIEMRKQFIAHPDNPLLQWDRLFDHLETTLNLVYLLANVHPDEEIREACDEGAEFLFSMQSQLALDESIFEVMRQYAEDASDLTPHSARFLNKIMKDYWQQGFQLDEEGREHLSELNQTLDQLEMAFHRHIGNSKPILVLSEEEAACLPADFKARLRRTEAGFEAEVVSPDYELMIKYLPQEHLRKELYLTFHSRAREENLPVLEQLFATRREKAHLLGFPSYAHLVLSGAMTAEPDRVRDFLEQLREKLLPKSEFDYRMLCNTAGTTSMASWNKFFYTKCYKEQRHGFAEADIRPYFPLDRVVKGMFNLGERLFGVRFEREQVCTWHEDVACYRLLEAGVQIGRVYLDLLARDGKYGLNACFSLRNGRRLENGSYQQPESVMVCSFPPAHDGAPSLLNHQDICNLFHEFGHLMHHELSKAPYASLAGTSVLEDFVEMPSQIMENWAWEPEILKQLSGHYQTGAALPAVLLEKMIDAKYLNTGINAQQQVFYAALDLALNLDYQPGQTRTSALVEHLQERYTMYPMSPGTCMEASFVHLVGYAATYYGYLWSRVYADDMFSLFKRGGLQDPELGKRFRQMVLEPGNTEDPMTLVCRFLGRQPDMSAYLETLGVATEMTSVCPT